VSAEGKLSLEDQRQSIRNQLQAHRLVVERQLTPPATDPNDYPRSLTMRLLIQQPELVAKLVALFAGARFAGSVPAILSLAQKLPSAGAAHAAPADTDIKTADSASV
jgi:hypothetical protein